MELGKDVHVIKVQFNGAMRVQPQIYVTSYLLVDRKLSDVIIMSLNVL